MKDLTPLASKIASSITPTANKSSGISDPLIQGTKKNITEISKEASAALSGYVKGSLNAESLEGISKVQTTLTQAKPEIKTLLDGTKIKSYLDGTEKMWHLNGQLGYEKLSDGTTTRWNENGVITNKTLLDKTRIEYDNKGRKSSVWFPDGTHQEYKNGDLSFQNFPDGTKKFWHENGQLGCEELPDGTHKCWDWDGNLIKVKPISTESDFPNIPPEDGEYEYVYV